MKKWIEKAPKPVEKPAHKDDGSDLFDDDEPTAVQAPKPKVEEKKKKEKPIAKSIVIF